MYTNMTKRIRWIDISKGIAILLVIIGHCLEHGRLRALIFGFHMPLFFILSSMTTSYSKNIKDFKNKTIKAFKHLIIPAILVFIAKTTIDYIFNISDIKYVTNYSLGYIFITNFKEYLLYNLKVLLYASGTEAWKNDVIIRPIGIIWFLFVLFIARTIYDLMQVKLNKKVCVILCVVLSIIGTQLKDFSYNVFSFDISLVILPLFFIGSIFKEKELDLEDKKIFIIGFIIYVVSCLFLYKDATYLELAARKYPYYPICFIIAIIGVLCVRSFSRLIENNKVSNILEFIGKNSMTLYLIHYFDYLYIRTNTYNSFSNVIGILIRVFVDLLIMYIFYKGKRIIKSN